MSLTCQILLISICAFFHLAPGDAMKCHACSALNESGPCEPVEDCEIDENEACSATKVYEDAMKCHVCRALDESGPCELEEDCEIDENGACASARVYENEGLIALIRGCWPDKNDLCGEKEEYPDLKTTIELKCCDSDSCNQDL
ncbi:low-density lipoprotein receptor-related protein 1-like isoform X2 [Anolis carolinensis]|uniref:low-density lipoprotein receptor-related protein 1-like isoform X2 n=1 Tax=Anolis carolinensis TaxID=28377 RepID=UPI002F2B3DB5